MNFRIWIACLAVIALLAGILSGGLAHLPFRAVIGILWGTSEMVLSLTKRSGSNAVSKDRHSLRLIWFVNLTATALGVIAAYRLPAFEMPWRHAALRMGFALFIVGSALRWYAIYYLGRFFTVNVAVASDHRVIDTGPYRLIRHPSYTGSLLAVFGFSVAMGNWISFLLIFVPCFGVALWRIHVEEQALAAGLGDSYRNYMRRTRRLVPGIY